MRCFRRTKQLVVLESNLGISLMKMSRFRVVAVRKYSSYIILEEPKRFSIALVGL